MSKCTKTAIALAATVVTVFNMFSLKGHNTFSDLAQMLNSKVEASQTFFKDRTGKFSMVVE